MITSLVAGELIRMGFRQLKHVKMEDVERVARVVGFSRHSSLMPSVGLIGVGIALGAGIAVLASPERGQALRDKALQILKSTMSSSQENGHNYEANRSANTAVPSGASA